MAQDANQVVVGGNGAVYVAPFATGSVNLPTTVSVALNAVFLEVGFASEDGITFSSGATIEDIKAWQSAYPIRKLVTERSAALEYVLRQWNKDTVPLAFGGGTLSGVGGVTKYLPPSPDVITLLSMIIEWTDGSDKFRLVIPRGQVSGEVSTNVVRTEAADLPIHFDATPSGAPDVTSLLTQPWYLLTNAFITT